MGVLTVEVLLVGPTASGSSQLLQWLGSRGCGCHFANNCKQACGLVSRSDYDLVLSEYDLPDRAAYPLLEQLIGSTSTLFLSTIVENGFLWVPALLRGRTWPDAHMLRPGELSEVLSDVLKKKVRYEKAEREKMIHAATLGDALELVVVAPAPGDARNRAGLCAASSQPRSRVATVLAEHYKCSIGSTNGPLSQKQLGFRMPIKMKKEIALAVRGPVIDRRLLLTSQPRGVLSPRSSVIEQTLRSDVHHFQSGHVCSDGCLREFNRMRRILRFLSRALVLFVCGLSTELWAEVPMPAPTQNSLPPLLRDVGIDQRLNSQVPLDLVFRDETGKEVKLGEYFGQKPVVLVLAYYDCPMLCTIVLNGVLHSVKELKYNIGQEFEVVTVSFDPTEKPSLAAAKKAIYVGLYGRPNASAGWHFLTGDEPSIRQLTQAVGFRYNYDPQTKQYFHATGIMVLTPDGRLARYFYGIQYPAGNLRLGLVEASQGKIGSPVDQVLLYCSQYDPATGKYSVIVSHVLKLAALATVLSLGGLVLAMSLGKKRAAA